MVSKGFFSINRIKNKDILCSELVEEQDNLWQDYRK